MCTSTRSMPSYGTIVGVVGQDGARYRPSRPAEAKRDTLCRHEAYYLANVLRIVSAYARYRAA